MHIVFACYQGFASNSAGHVFCLANALAHGGIRVTVFVPFDAELAQNHGVTSFDVQEFAHLPNWLEEQPIRPQETILVAWTPRENVRRFAQAFLHNIHCPYLVHLEDNEQLITARNIGCDLYELEKLSTEELDRRLAADDRLSHPHHFRKFLADADGLTVLMDTLRTFGRPRQAVHVFWPGFNDRFFSNRPVDFAGRRELSIDDDELVLTYSGNVHSANQTEVLSLYLSIALVNRLGFKTRLIRTGEDFAPVLDASLSEIQEHVIHLGKLASQSEVANAMAMANVLVQPGRSDSFNDYRFPSKLPEFFAMGRPVILPAANLGRFVRDGEDCLVLRRGDAFEIAEHLQQLHRNPVLAERLGRNALTFANKHFRWEYIARNYGQFLTQFIRIPSAC